MRNNQPVVDRETPVGAHVLIVSKTDLKGRITYVNRDFLQISGFTEDELIGKPHNIVRHPDMPEAAFADLWDTLKAGRPWTGLVKNRCKDGSYYWVEANATPIRENGAVVGYMSVRRGAERSAIAGAEALYRAFREGRQGARRIVQGGVSTAWGARAARLMQWRALVLLGLAAVSAFGALALTAAGVTAGAVTIALVNALAVAGLAWTWGRDVRRPLDAATRALHAIGAGDYRVAVDIRRDDAPGRLLQAVQSMQIQLGFNIAETRRVAEEALRIRIGLDNVATNVMIADDGGRIIYMNQSVQAMFAAAEADLKQALPAFDRTKLLGANMDVFHRDPRHQRHMLEKLTATHRARVTVGGHVFALTVTPVIDAQGHRLGFAVEWLDRTAEVAMEGELQRVVDAAAQGDFSGRIALATDNAFFRQMCDGLNRLFATNERVLNELSTVMQALADGDMTKQLEGEYAGRYAQLKADINRTVERLGELTGRIRGAAEAIGTATREIAQGNNDLSARTESQASSLEQTASSMEEITSTVKMNADTARQAAVVAAEATRAAEQGGRTVGEVIGTMEAIAESSARIQDIIGVIDGIAFQTNILALNAAVEAARAGAEGRGFAVVAAEVRSLAQRSAVAAKEIKELIATAGTRVDAGKALVHAAGEQVGSIVRAVENVGQLIAEISAASSEQAGGIEQVNIAVTQMDEVTQQNAALVEEAAAAASSLQEQAEGLANAASAFRTRGAVGTGSSRVSVEIAGTSTGWDGATERRATTRPGNVSRAFGHDGRALQRPVAAPRKDGAADRKEPAAKKTAAGADWTEF